MIVARLTQNGEPIAGSSGLAVYPAEDGWFPISSFNFGLEKKQDEDKARQTAAGGGAAAGATAGRAGASASVGSAPAAGAKKNDGDFSGMSISKEIDATTCYLMWLCMIQRKSKHGIRDSTADIHVLSSVTIDNRRFIYPSLMIHLAGVVVESWSISGSGDERPTENVGLKYDKAAMNYRSTPDGKTFKDHPPLGISWDQTTQKEMEPRYEGFSKFL